MPANLAGSWLRWCACWGFDEAEEALHEAFAAAAEQWPSEGVPSNPYAWLVSVGRFKTINRWRRQGRVARVLPELLALAEPAPEPTLRSHIDDDELRLIFTCCHPSLPPDARAALTLREVARLTTEEIARAYLVQASTIAQRIVRAKAKLRDELVPYEVPAPSELPARLASVLSVLYLIYNEGYVTTQNERFSREDLCEEAVRLARLLVQLTRDPEAQGLLALMLLHEARRAARVDEQGDLVLLENQIARCGTGRASRKANGGSSKPSVCGAWGPLAASSDRRGAHDGR